LDGRKGTWPVKKRWYAGGGDLTTALHVLRFFKNNFTQKLRILLLLAFCFTNAVCSTLNGMSDTYGDKPSVIDITLSTTPETRNKLLTAWSLICRPSQPPNLV